jgi:hypothetical protein
MTEEAIRSVEALLSETIHPKSRLECLRLLFGLLHRSDPTDPRCVNVAWQIGEQARPDREEEEGLFLVTMLAATLYAPLGESDPKLPELQRRIQEFTRRFPESTILRSESLPDSSSPDDLIQALKRISGHDEERETWRRNIETQLQRGHVHLPYAWRPRIILNSVPDVPTLWELSKRSRSDQQELHLQMSTDKWEPIPLVKMRGRIPLLDMSTLQVVHDLELFELLFRIFPEVAIGQRTIVELAQHSSPMLGSFMREKCLAIQSLLTANVSRIRQPLAEIDDGAIREQLRPLEEIKSLATNSAYLMYCDDALFRVYCDPPGSPKYLCSLDILAALDESGWLSPQEVSAKLAKLCRWHVGVAVTTRYQLAALPDELGEVRNVEDGVVILRAFETSAAIFGGIWGGSKPYSDLQAQASQLLRTLVSDPKNSAASIAALMALWHEKARLRSDAPAPPIRVAVLLVLQATSIDGSPSPGESSRLWTVFRALVENEFGDRMDERKEREAIALAGEVAAGIDFKKSSTPLESLHSRLAKGLTEGTKDEEVFSSAYSRVYVGAAARTRQ